MCIFRFTLIAVLGKISAWRINKIGRSKQSSIAHPLANTVYNKTAGVESEGRSLWDGFRLSGQEKMPG